MEIDWNEVSQPFQYDRSNEHWVTNGAVDMTENEDGSYTVTNETVGISVTAPSLEEAMSTLNNQVRKALNKSDAFRGRPGL